MTNHIEDIQEQLDLLEHHIEQRHRQARHERKTILQHIRTVRRRIKQLKVKE